LLDPRFLTGQNSLVSHHVTFALSSAEYIYISKYFECNRVIMKKCKKITHRTFDLGFPQLCDRMPCSLLKVNGRFGGIYRLHLQNQRISRARNQREGRWQADPSSEPDSACHLFSLVSCSNYSSTLEMEVICSSETSVDFQRTIRCLWN
jgi:hypothetical protein